jgi:NAD(P)-dependent dehydrogenase (short-subunit alcohol dehydrogenase family)
MAIDRPRGPETVAAAIAFLASDDAAHINGESLRVDGGTLA